MYICAKCGIEMTCQKNGVGADFGHGHVYRSDLHVCKICGCQILATAKEADYDPDYTGCDGYLKCD